LESKSARMRQLFAQGKSVSEVAKLVGVDYQFAYGVAKRAGFIEAGATVPREQRQSDRGLPRFVDIEANLRTYLKDRRPTDRYASFDYCFNHFQSRREGGRIGNLATGLELQLACLHLGFYLASWGMYRGSTVLLQRSVAYLVPVVEAIARTSAAAWAIDADGYTHEACSLLLDTASRIRATFPEGATDTLVTKIMLGVFGSVPAYDTNFRKGFGTAIFGESSLMRIGRFYRENAQVIERHRVPTLAFDAGAETDRRYPRAKVIDMIFFIEGGATA
jgi:hypothetical protein